MGDYENMDGLSTKPKETQKLWSGSAAFATGVFLLYLNWRALHWNVSTFSVLVNFILAGVSYPMFRFSWLHMAKSCENPALYILLIIGALFAFDFLMDIGHISSWGASI